MLLARSLLPAVAAVAAAALPPGGPTTATPPPPPRPAGVAARGGCPELENNDGVNPVPLIAVAGNCGCGADAATGDVADGLLLLLLLLLVVVVVLAPAGGGESCKLPSSTAMAAAAAAISGESAAEANLERRRVGDTMCRMDANRSSSLYTGVGGRTQETGEASRLTRGRTTWPPAVGTCGLWSCEVIIQFSSAFGRRGLRTSDGTEAYADPVRLSRVTTPVLFMCGDRDRMCPPQGAAATCALFTGSRCARFVEIGPAYGTRDHYGHFDILMGRRVEQEVFPLLTAWLDEHDTDAVQPTATDYGVPRQQLMQQQQRTELTLLEPHFHRALGGMPMLPSQESINHHNRFTRDIRSGPGQKVRRDDNGTDEDRGDCSHGDGGAAVGQALANLFPNLKRILFAGAAAGCELGAGVRPGGYGGLHGRGGGDGTGAASAVPPLRALLAPQALLEHLAAALAAGGGGGGRDGVVSCCAAQVCSGGGGGGASMSSTATGLQALVVDYAQPSIDPFEAELLDPQFARLPLLLLDFRGLAAAAAVAAAAADKNGSGGCAAAAAAQHPILRQSPMQHPIVTAPPPPPPLLLQLASLELRGVAVQPGLLTGLRELTRLTKLVLSVSCSRPYEPYLKRLAHLHLFLHVPTAAAARQLSATAAVAAAAAGGTTVAVGGMQRNYIRGGGGAGAGGGFEDVDVNAPDCTAVQLAAAVSQCRGLVSLGLPGEGVDSGQMPAVLQALPRLTRLETRQFGSWDLPHPHTSIRSLTLSMTWPSYLAHLLPNLPVLQHLRADMYIHAEGDYCGGGGRRRGRRRRGGDDDGGCSGVEQLYDDLLAVTSGLRGVCDVELQLSVMRSEPWEWSRVVRLLAGVRGLRGLTLRMPHRDSGPPLGTQHFSSLCRQLTSLRRLTLLLAHPNCSKLNAKALKVGRSLGRWVIDWVGQAAECLKAAAGMSTTGPVAAAAAAAAPHQDPFDAAAAGDEMNCGRRTGRSGKYDKKYMRESSTGCGSCGAGGTARQRSARREAAEVRQRRRRRRQEPSCLDDGGRGGGSCTGENCAPPLPPYGSAPWAVLEAARGLRDRTGLPPPRPLRPQQPTNRQRGGGGGGGGGGSTTSGSESNSPDGSDRGGSFHTDNSTDEDEDTAREEQCAPLSRSAPSLHRSGSDYSDYEGCRGGGGGGGRDGGTGTGSSCSGRLAACRSAVEIQVDFLTVREVAGLNAVLRREGGLRPVRVRAGLHPPWVWADMADSLLDG
ncbi:hypothetical protein VOLCADRAFT_90617 [Volvox carteri f. nagariensis]|uniref:Serine aminopeptidase S33 domain-containing protein n=1 Tax=Volvox carteri f. nagariensis TaxID=3068 RepID=D8TUW2_VOLCA|nr:uncharacterized protein VOLCADRAFT_90617 [Volvox carteri f. nagariensis]EFJ48781.1 hypothetical protein VOLCADRAFT_90617 [Volvox carteri f. nagariensis]|eukprot:XP_002950113.1 hypothetical protein VOLCADRAFT_90617 [Volvox carteri f. nagariensis]